MSRSLYMVLFNGDMGAAGVLVLKKLVIFELRKYGVGWGFELSLTTLLAAV